MTKQRDAKKYTAAQLVGNIVKWRPSNKPCGPVFYSHDKYKTGEYALIVRANGNNIFLLWLDSWFDRLAAGNNGVSEWSLLTLVGDLILVLEDDPGYDELHEQARYRLLERTG